MRRGRHEHRQHRADPAIRVGITVVDGSLAATLAEAEETDDLGRRFVWQCQRCGNEGYSLEDVLEPAG